MQSHDLATITVQMICERADVARSTFYAHYQTRTDLLDDVFAAGEEAIPPGGLDATLLWLAGRLAEAQGFHRRLQGTQAGHAIMTRFRRATRGRLVEDLGAEARAPEAMGADYLTGGVFAVLEAWMAGGCHEAPALVAEALGRLIRQAP